MNILADTHCHLTFDLFKEDLDLVIDRALSVGITRILVPGFDIPSSEAAVELADRHSMLYAGVGVHPNSSQSWDSKSLSRLQELTNATKVVAVGEIGLDFYRHPDNADKQISIFTEQLELATDKSLPVLIHNRKSSEKMIECLARYSIFGILHAFDGDPQILEYGLSHNYFFGLGGAITYHKSLLDAPIMERIWQKSVLETDSPFLSPNPYRGIRNEPARIMTIAEYSAKIMNVPMDEISKVTTNNANALFKWNQNEE